MENSTELALKTEINIYTGASMLKITDEEQTKLLASFETKEIEIRPDGLIYLPQTFWRKRLNESFGIGQWCLIIKSNTKDPDRSKLYLQGVLMVRGSYVAESVGEAEYHETNEQQSWASVWESAKSDCITRCCKDLGIASELWQPEFIRKWIAENAIDVWCEMKFKDGTIKPKKLWRKKDSKPFWNEKNSKQSENIHEPKITSNEPKPAKKYLNPNTPQWTYAIKYLKEGHKIEEIEKKYSISLANREKLISEAI